MANLLSTGIYGFLCSLKKTVEGYIESSFNSGQSGWMITNDGSAEFKSVYARDKLITNEFVYNRIRVTEDEEIISSNGRIEEAKDNGNDYYTISLDLREGDTNPFAEGDLLIGYYHSPRKSGEIYSIQKFTVTSDPSKVDQSMQVKADPVNTGQVEAEYKSYPHKHMIIVRVGNNNNEDRRAFIKISSRTNCQYFYDGIDSWTAFDDPDNVKCFLGKISDNTMGLVPKWAKSAVGTLKKFFLIADGVILKGTFVLKSEKTIEEEIENTKVSGKNLMRRSSCISKAPVNDVGSNRPMAVNTEIYGAHRMNDGFAQINGEGDYYWYVGPADATTIPPQSSAESAMYNLWGGFTSSYESLGIKNFVAEYNNYYTMSFDYYFDAKVGDIPLAARFYWGTTYPGTEDVTETVYKLLNKTPGVWHHCELTVDLRSYKQDVFESGRNIFFQMRTISGWGQNYAGWKMYHRNIQLEKGYSATDWAPALQDMQDSIKETKNFVEYSMNGMQSQLDGKIETWFQESDPSNDWDFNTKQNHIGDMWYNSKANSLKYYSNAYEWVKVEDQKAIDAYNKASNAQDTADGKRRIFVDKPDTPYDKGDIWVQGDEGEIMRCVESKVTGEYNEEHWNKASKYTDDSNLNTFVKTTYQAFTTQTVQDFIQLYSASNEHGTRVSKIEQTAEQISLSVDQIPIGSQNYVTNGDFSRVYDLTNVEWDPTKNGNLAAENWSTGYNNGVADPTNGYHAHISKLGTSGNVLLLPNLNSEIGQGGRWLALMQNLPDLSDVISEGDEYTISMDVKCTAIDQKIKFGLHLLPFDGRVQDFYDGMSNITLDKKNTEGVCRIQQTFKSTGIFNRYDLYIYGHYGNEGIIYVKNISLYKGNKAHWTPSKKDLENDTANLLLPTGIDIENKKITLTADKTEIRDNSGNMMFKLFKADGTLNDSVLDIAGVISSNGLNVNDNFVIDRSGRFSSKDGYIEGEIKATSGSIGDLLISNGDVIGRDSDGITRIRVSKNKLSEFAELGNTSKVDLYDEYSNIATSTGIFLSKFKGQTSLDPSWCNMTMGYKAFDIIQSCEIEADFKLEMVDLTYSDPDSSNLQYYITKVRLIGSKGETVGIFDRNNRIMVGAPGKYSIEVDCFIELQYKGDPLKNYHLYVSGRLRNTASVSALYTQQCTLIGSDGLFSYWGPQDYFYAKKNAQGELDIKMRGNIEVLSRGGASLLKG